MLPHLTVFCFFFFNDTATTEIYTLSLHDALPIWTLPYPRSAPLRCERSVRRRPSERHGSDVERLRRRGDRAGPARADPVRDRKSTRLNSSHLVISYAVFCLKKKKIASILRYLSTY